MKEKTVMGQPLEALPLSFFDLETTGLSASNGHRICEIALLRVRGTKIESTYTTLINPQRAIAPQAFAVNGISQSMVRQAPPFADIANTILQLIEGSVLIAHNAPFDISFLTYELTLLGKELPDHPVLDTLVLARQLMQCPSHSLPALSKQLGLHIPDHRAMNDVLSLRGLFEHLTILMTPLGITTLADVLRFQRGLLPHDPELPFPPIIQQALQEKRFIRIIYRSRSTPQPHQRIIRPIELMKSHNLIYLRAYCTLRKDIRAFDLNKIEEMELE